MRVCMGCLCVHMCVCVVCAYASVCVRTCVCVLSLCVVSVYAHGPKKRWRDTVLADLQHLHISETGINCIKTEMLGTNNARKGWLSN